MPPVFLFFFAVSITSLFKISQLSTRCLLHVFKKNGIKNRKSSLTFRRKCCVGSGFYDKSEWVSVQMNFFLKKMTITKRLIMMWVACVESWYQVECGARILNKSTNGEIKQSMKIELMELVIEKIVKHVEFCTSISNQRLLRT